MFHFTSVLLFSDIACKVGTLDSHLHVVDLPETKTVKSGNKIRFVCDEPYAVDGPEEIECSGHEQWSADFPTCSGMFIFNEVKFTKKSSSSL